jgi:hypothetical protein
MRAGFAEIDITPPVGTQKIGWIRDNPSDNVLDPLFARIAVFESDDERIGFVQLDTLTIRWTHTNAIRERISDEYGFPGEHVMVSATHNHAGPAISNCGEVIRDEGYIRDFLDRIVAGYGEALANLTEAELGFGSCFEFNVARNRRVMMRHGTTRTHGRFDDPDALCIEGPFDPEVAVVAARAPDGRLLGALVNFTCHPAHHGGDGTLSAGFPGVLAREMASSGCPVTLFLQGAAGNIHSSRPTEGGQDLSMEDVGERLATDARSAIESMEWHDSLRLEARQRTIQLPYRTVTDDEIKGSVRGAQRFIDSAIYDRVIPKVVRRIKERGLQPAEVQALRLGDHVFISLPCEPFVELGLRIKERVHPLRAKVVGYANGNVGYVPTNEAFARGGYETTFTCSSRMAPECGDLLVDAAVGLVTRE